MRSCAVGQVSSPGARLSSALASAHLGMCPSPSPSLAAAPQVGVVRQKAGQRWVDTTLAEWPEDDFRVFVGNLGNEVGAAALVSTWRRPCGASVPVAPLLCCCRRRCCAPPHQRLLPLHQRLLPLCQGLRKRLLLHRHCPLLRRQRLSNQVQLQHLLQHPGKNLAARPCSRRRQLRIVAERQVDDIILALLLLPLWLPQGLLLHWLWQPLPERLRRLHETRLRLLQQGRLWRGKGGQLWRREAWQRLQQQQRSSTAPPGGAAHASPGGGAPPRPARQPPRPQCPLQQTLAP